MTLVSITTPNDGETIDAADVATPLNAITAVVNGNLDNSNIASGAAITGSKLADSSIDLGAKTSTWDGWIAVSDSWTYASASTITVPSDATTKYSVGDKIKFTQTSVKYFVIVGVSSTTLTVTGGTTYTVANAAISSIYYSKSTSPLNFPQWFAYTPTFTGFSADPTPTGTRFTVNGRTCIVNYACFGGTSNASTMTVTLPVTAATNGGSYVRDFALRGQNNSTTPTNACLGEFDSGATTMTLYNDLSGAAWTGSGTKGFRGVISYEI